MFLRSSTAAIVGVALAAAAFQIPAAQANPAGTNVVISEVFGGGGNSGAPVRSDFIELYNPTDAAISLSGMSVLYRSATGSAGGAAVPLSGSVPAKGHYLIKAADGSNASAAALPAPDATTTFSMSGTAGQVLLINGTSFTGSGNVAGNANLVDMVGYGSGTTTFEGAAMGSNLSNTTSASRSATGTDTDNNRDDFQAGTPSPRNSADGGSVTPPTPDPVSTIAEIQGTGSASPLVGQTVTTTGVVTATYPTGGFNGIYIQTPGTGGSSDATPGASDAIFVFGPNAGASSLSIGDTVKVTGVVSEFNGLTEITPAAGGVVKVAAAAAVEPRAIAYPTTAAGREAHEGELLAPTDAFTVSNTFTLNQFAEIGLATGSKPLLTPTEVADAQDTAGIAAVVADNEARGVVLDDGASINFLSNANKSIPLPWLSPANPVRVGAAARLVAPVVLDFRNNTWKFQPQAPVTDEGTSVATFAKTRTPAPEAVGGNLRLATFNVLNYFNTTGEDFVASGGSCTYFLDRAGNPNSVNDCGPTGPRGAAQADDLTRQQTKIVAAINALDADIVSLEEIENSVVLGEDRDDALSALVRALNDAAGSTRWAFAPSPAAADLPALSEQDVIRTGFIYNPQKVSLVGGSKVLVGSAAFSNAREPLAQAFKPKGVAASSTFAVVVNHFKSKGSGADDGTGQGLANPDRVAQATDLVPFAQNFASSRGTDQIFLTGDFNSYSKEDPIQVLEAAGFGKIDSDTPNEWSYSFDGKSGSLDHVFANAPARQLVTGSDIWNINAVESVAWEYSRTNYNVADLYQPNAYRSSDHDPQVVGLNVPATPEPVTLNLLSVNDFHGRINSNTVKWAGTVEQLRAEEGANNTLFISAGDLIGASEFISASQEDQPTIDMFDALGLDVSAVGNHEFDRGWPDLRDRVIGPSGARNADFPNLGANVYAKGTKNPVLPEFATFNRAGLRVGVIGAVTEETSSLVSPAGIADIEFGNAVEAINRVAAKLTDGNEANGEADVLVASIHAGAEVGAGSSYAAEAAKGGEFAQMAELDPSIDAIFNAHTHQVYAWEAPIPGRPGATRPILQSGQYGANVGQIRLVIDPTTKNVISSNARNVARTTVADSTLIATYPRLAEVKRIVDAATATAAQIGNRPVGRITADITTAYSGGSAASGTYTGGTRDDRASESALGDLVANALRDGLPAGFEADLGVVNPGGLRAELLFAGNPAANPANTDGVVTFGEANSVLPFANDIWTVRLTGASLKAVLEQQWQPDGSSRPFLALGLSDNVRVTQDPSKPRGSRITSVVIDGEPLVEDRIYSVSTFSFLGAGGDNFTAFTQGTATETGLIDRDLWIKYLETNQPLSPDFARQQVVESGLPSTVTAGQQVEFTLSKLNLTSLGAPVNTTVTAYVRTPELSRAVGTFPLTDGTATVSFRVPEELTGSATVTVVASPTRTVVGLPLTSTEQRDQTITFPQPANTVFGGADVSLTASASSDLPVTLTSTTPTVCTVVAGKARPLAAGTCTIRATQPGNFFVKAAPPATRSLTVAKAPLTVTTQATTGLTSLATGRHTYVTTVRSAVTGQPVAGVSVTTRINGLTANSGCTAVTDARGVATCRSNKVTVTLGSWSYTATVAESANYRGGTATARIRNL